MQLPPAVCLVCSVAELVPGVCWEPKTGLSCPVALLRMDVVVFLQAGSVFVCKLHV